jgi:hypothetical protein
LLASRVDSGIEGGQESPWGDGAIRVLKTLWAIALLEIKPGKINPYGTNAAT